MTKLFHVLISSAATLIFLASPALVVAATPTVVVMEKKATVAAETTTATAPASMEKDGYLLPYPGILPDHPLYFLKGLRDRILEGLIVDPLRKSEFYILQADKRLNMAIFLDAKGNQLVMEQIVSKGEKYMEKAVMGLEQVKTNGGQIPVSTLDRLQKSLVKHIEVLDMLLAKANDAQKAGLSQSLEMVKKLQADLGKLQ